MQVTDEICPVLPGRSQSRIVSESLSSFFYTRLHTFSMSHMSTIQLEEATQTCQSYGFQPRMETLNPLKVLGRHMNSPDSRIRTWNDTSLYSWELNRCSPVAHRQQAKL